MMVVRFRFGGCTITPFRVGMNRVMSFRGIYLQIVAAGVSVFDILGENLLVGMNILINYDILPQSQFYRSGPCILDHNLNR